MENLPTLDKFGYVFQYPDDALVYAFNVDNCKKGLEIIVQREALSYRILIEPVAALISAEEIAQKAFDRLNSELLADDVPPHEFQTRHGTGQRLRKVFLDGFKVPFIQEMVVLQMPGESVQIQLAAAPDHFFEALKEFESLLQSFTYLTA